MKFAVIGSDHAHVFRFVEHMKAAGGVFAGVWEDGHPHTRRLMDEYGAQAYPSWESVLAEHPGIVGCFAPNGRRMEIVEACSAAGIPVMSDKPLVVNEDGLRQLTAVMEKGTPVSMMYTLRFEKIVRALKVLLDSGELGRLINMEIFNPHQLHPERRPDWHFDPAHGTVASDLLTHSVDLFRWFTGGEEWEYREAMVTKSILPEKPGFEDLAAAHVRTKSGVSGYFRSDWHMPETNGSWGDCRIFVTGSRGMAEARVTGDPLTRKETLIVYSPERGTFEADPESMDLGSGAENESVDFLDRLAGRPHIITQEDVLESCREALMLDRIALRADLTEKEEET